MCNLQLGLNSLWGRKTVTHKLSPGSGCSRVELERMSNQSRGRRDERHGDERKHEESIIDLLLGVRERDISGMSNLMNGVAMS